MSIGLGESRQLGESNSWQPVMAPGPNYCRDRVAIGISTPKCHRREPHPVLLGCTWAV